MSHRSGPRRAFWAKGSVGRCTCAVGVLLGAALILMAGPLTAQDLTLVVRVIDAETRQPVVAAGILHRAADSTVLVRTTTDPRGIAEIPISIEPPYSLTVERLGYVETGRQIEEVGLLRDGRWLIQIMLERSPIEIDGITAEAEAWEGYFGPWIFRGDGMYHERAPDFCMYLVVDEVLITDPREMLRQMQRFFTTRSPTMNRPSDITTAPGLRAVTATTVNSGLPEQYREAAWPCGATALWSVEYYLRHGLGNRRPPW